MIFESLYESAQNSELILVEGGYCRYHVRKNGQLTIYEILTTIRGQGIGVRMLERLKSLSPSSIVAKCPDDLRANYWYAANGFVLDGTETTRSGRTMNVWKLLLD